MPQKLPANNFEWIEETSQFNENYIKNYNEESDEAHYLEVDVQYPQKLYELHMDILLYLKERYLKKLKSLLLIYMIRMNTLYT